MSNIDIGDIVRGKRSYSGERFEYVGEVRSPAFENNTWEVEIIEVVEGEAYSVGDIVEEKSFDLILEE